MDYLEIIIPEKLNNTRHRIFAQKRHVKCQRAMIPCHILLFSPSRYFLLTGLWRFYWGLFLPCWFMLFVFFGAEVSKMACCKERACHVALLANCLMFCPIFPRVPESHF